MTLLPNTRSDVTLHTKNKKQLFLLNSESCMTFEAEAPRISAKGVILLHDPPTSLQNSNT